MAGASSRSAADKGTAGGTGVRTIQSFSTAQLPKLLQMVTRLVAEASLIAVVAADVPKLAMREPVNESPFMLFAVALPVTMLIKFRIALVSLNSQFSTAKSVGVFVLVAVKTEATSAKLATNRQF